MAADGETHIIQYDYLVEVLMSRQKKRKPGRTARRNWLPWLAGFAGLALLGGYMVLRMMFV